MNVRPKETVVEQRRLVAKNMNREKHDTTGDIEIRMSLRKTVRRDAKESIHNMCREMTKETREGHTASSKNLDIPNKT